MSRFRRWLKSFATPMPRKHVRPGIVEHLEDRRLMSVYFVSPVGSDQSVGSIGAPFQTIQQAASIAEPGDTVVVHAGVYHETVTPAHSGTAGKPITYEPFGDGPVIVSGADPVSGWTLQQGNVYQAPAGWDLGTGNNQVFFNGQALSEARWPAATLDLSHPAFAHATSATSTIADGNNASSATLYDPALTQPAGFWVGATLHIAPGQGWAIQTGTVTASSIGQVTYSYTSNSKTRPYENPSAGNEYYLSGVAGELDAAGEWFVGSGSISLWTPDGTDPQTDDIEVKHRLFAFDLSGLSDITVRGFSIFAAGINTDASSTGLTLSDLNLQYVSQAGVVPQAWGQPEQAGVYLNGANNVLRDSTIAFSATDGVAIGGTGCTVQGCIIHDTDYSGANFVAIAIYGAGNTAEDNVVYNCGREGIRMNAAATVINNVVHDVMLQTTDGGGIYTYGTNGAGGEIAYNQVYNVNTAGFGGVGIYLDNNDSNWHVDHNSVWNCTSAMKLNPVNSNDLIEYNVLANCKYSITSSQSEAMPGTVFSNNLFTSSTAIGPGATEVNDTRNASFQPPGNPIVGSALAASHGSLTPPVNTGPLLATDAAKVQSDQSQLASDQASQMEASVNDAAAMNSAVTSASLNLSNDIASEAGKIAAEAIAIRHARQSAAKAVKHKVGAARERLMAQLTSGIPTLAQYKSQLKTAIASDRTAIVTARAQWESVLQTDQAHWAVAVAADQQAVSADDTALQADAA